VVMGQDVPQEALVVGITRSGASMLQNYLVPTVATARLGKLEQERALRSGRTVCSRHPSDVPRTVARSLGTPVVEADPR
jgi:hypothetical protein